MKYIHISQKPYCCVPASLSMILNRRGIKSPSQEDIAYDLGVVLAPKDKHLLTKSHNTLKEKSGYGTRIHLKPYSLTTFFKKRKYKLKEQYIPANRFKTISDFKMFLQRNINEGNDQLICFNQGYLKKKKKSWGHCTIITRVGEKVVFMRDPDPRRKDGERRVYIKELLGAIRNHYKGGVWVISSIKK